MQELQFEWDDRKEKANIRKHGISFDEARTVFYDENAIQFFDPDHSEDEDRFILLGLYPTRNEFQTTDSCRLSLFSKK